jgi:hypothetical protein
MVKDYQDLMYSKGFGINNEDTIREITTFVKHTTTAGNTKYAADVGHDDCVMTIVNTTSIFQKTDFKEMVDEWSNKHTDKEMMQFINQCMNNIDFVEGVDYGSFLRAKNLAKPRSGKSNMGGSWFGIG